MKKMKRMKKRSQMSIFIKPYRIGKGVKKRFNLFFKWRSGAIPTFFNMMYSYKNKCSLTQWYHFSDKPHYYYNIYIPYQA